jgi:hypothetical protein
VNLDFVPPDLEFVPGGLDFVPKNLDFVPGDLEIRHRAGASALYLAEEALWIFLRY